MKKYKSLAEELDKAIRQYETQGGKIEAGYMVDGKEPAFENYLSEDCWKDFYNAMKENNPTAFECYDKGSGGEMKPYEHKGKKYPPKMASFGSSSRMIYNLVMSNTTIKKDFLFEEQLSTTIGGKANLDGFIQKGNNYIFVEAKCREPYSSKSKRVKIAYDNLYKAINISKTLTCHWDEDEIIDGKMPVTFTKGNVIIKHFDMKQMICHLLAVGTAVLTKHYEEMKNESVSDEDIKLNFIYLIYDPQKLEFEDNSPKEKIVKKYKDIFSFCEGNENQYFKSLFKVILEFLQSEDGLGDKILKKDVTKIVDNFNFYVCSQDNFNEKLQSLLI